MDLKNINGGDIKMEQVLVYLKNKNGLKMCILPASKENWLL